MTGGLLWCRPVDASTRVRESPPSYVVVVTQFVTHLMVRAPERTGRVDHQSGGHGGEWNLTLRSFKRTGFPVATYALACINVAARQHASRTWARIGHSADTSNGAEPDSSLRPLGYEANGTRPTHPIGF